MKKANDDHQVAGPSVDIAHKPTRRNNVYQVLDGIISPGCIRLVINHQKNPRQQQYGKQSQAHDAQPKGIIPAQGVWMDFIGVDMQKDIVYR